MSKVSENSKTVEVTDVKVTDGFENKNILNEGKNSNEEVLNDKSDKEINDEDKIEDKVEEILSEDVKMVTIF